MIFRNDLALSRLRGIKTIFRKSIVEQTQFLMDIEDVDLLKMLNYKAQAGKIYIVWFMLFNVTFNNISVISLSSILLVEETGIPEENHRPAVSH